MSKKVLISGGSGGIPLIQNHIFHGDPAGGDLTPNDTAHGLLLGDGHLFLGLQVEELYQSVLDGVSHQGR